MKTIKFLIATFIFLWFYLGNISAQLVYPIAGTYKGKSAQGMAIWGNKAYLFNDTGLCRVLNLKTEEVLSSFSIASSGEKTHVNTACFGNEYVGDSNIPVLYITEYNSPSRCFVECITDSTSVLVQTIQARQNGKNKFVQTWVVDRDNSFLYAITRQSPPKGQSNSKVIKIDKYRLPSLNEGDSIILTEIDMYDSFIVEFASGTQGSKIKGKYMYIVSGLQETSRGKYNAERAIQVIDLEKKELVRRIDLTYVTTNEPEDMDFYDSKALLYCGQNGGIYKIKLK